MFAIGFANHQGVIDAKGPVRARRAFGEYFLAFLFPAAAKSADFLGTSRSHASWS